MSWARLDPRGMVVTAVALGGVGVAAGVPTAVGIGSGSAGYGTALAWVLPAIALLMVAGAAVEYVRYRRTRFRVGADRVELRNGILALHHRTLPRERIRVVDLSADPLSRVLGLAQVRIGTGEQGGEGLTLWPVRAATGERLRAELLTRGTGTDRDGTLATFRTGWLRYGPISYLTPALGLAAIGVMFQGAQWIGQESALVEWFGGLAVLVGVVWLVVLGIAAVAVVGTVAALAVYAELWWNHRLDREPGGTLRVRRGLLTTRSISMEERRLRGIELVEPLGARRAGAARAGSPGRVRPAGPAVPAD
ncbi:PH domain-containing protein, partial [Pseudonocardia pini]|uniref:PH domain-containing protein n=1 Tax=Pseudonocardia pini TaxID=2758030 RepID=UPI0015F03956